jgi:hypothetical protein
MAGFWDDFKEDIKKKGSYSPSGAYSLGAQGCKAAVTGANLSVTGVSFSFTGYAVSAAGLATSGIGIQNTTVGIQSKNTPVVSELGALYTLTRAISNKLHGIGNDASGLKLTT